MVNKKRREDIVFDESMPKSFERLLKGEITPEEAFKERMKELRIDEME